MLWSEGLERNLLSPKVCLNRCCWGFSCPFWPLSVHWQRRVVEPIVWPLPRRRILFSEWQRVKAGRKWSLSPKCSSVSAEYMYTYRHPLSPGGVQAGTSRQAGGDSQTAKHTAGASTAEDEQCQSIWICLPAALTLVMLTFSRVSTALLDPLKAATSK